MQDSHTYSVADSLAKTMLERKVLDQATPDLNVLLKKTAAKSRHESNGKLLTFRRQTDRLQVFVLLFEIFTTFIEFISAIKSLLHAIHGREIEFDRSLQEKQ